MRPPRRLSRPLALGACALALAGAPGCQQLQQFAALASALQGAAGAGVGASPGFAGASLGTGPLGATPSLTGPGVTTPSPASGVTPPGAAASVQDFQQRYGFQVTGSGATPENLRRLALACEYYDPQRHLQALRQVELVDRGGPADGVAGLWQSDGSSGQVTLYAFSEGGPGNTILTHAAVHELGHHVCELTGRGSFTPQLEQNIQASPQPIPTQYAGSSDSELRAETVATLLHGGVERPPGYLANYQPSPALLQQVRGEFPRTSL